MVALRVEKIPVAFYRTSNGNEPVIEWLKSLPALDRHAIGDDLRTVQFSWSIGMPLCRSLGHGLWEVRSHLPRRQIARLLFFVENGRIGIVHGFIKKSQKTPDNDLALALKRMKEMQA